MYSSLFPDSLKHADITPIFKKVDRIEKSNYRPVSILPNTSKVYEICTYNQIYGNLMLYYLNFKVVSVAVTIDYVVYLLYYLGLFMSNKTKI